MLRTMVAVRARCQFDNEMVSLAVPERNGGIMESGMLIKSSWRWKNKNYNMTLTVKLLSSQNGNAGIYPLLRDYPSTQEQDLEMTPGSHSSHAPRLPDR